MAAMWSVIAYTVLTVAAFYFILLQPVLKKQKEAKKAVRELRIGDEVITVGGLIGEVKDVITPAGWPHGNHPRNSTGCSRPRDDRLRFRNA